MTLFQKEKSSLSMFRGAVILIGLFLPLMLLHGCATSGGSVVAATATTIGVELSQSQATQTPTAVLGYKRAELAYVPTNRGYARKTTTTEDSDGKPITTGDEGLPSSGSGARDTANVLMELKYSGIFDWSSKSGIYQRLAVGDIAVAQTGAAVMFAKDDNGNVDANAAQYIALAQQRITIENSRIGKIIPYVTDGYGAIDNSKIQGLVDAAQKTSPKIIQGTVITAIKTAKTGDELRKILTYELDFAIEPLYKSLPSDKQ